MEIKQGLIQGAIHHRSPHQDERPLEDDISLIVVHGISLPPGEFGGEAIIDFFCHRLDHTAHPYYAGIKDLEVSAHLVILRAGTLLQFVPFDKRAWHAGPSQFEGRERCNDFSIGIELEGQDDIPYTESQYQTLATVVGLLRRTYPMIERHAIVGHSDVAPGRKTDPGTAFDWDHFQNLVDLEKS